VIAILFLFLGNLRAALIPSITVPISPDLLLYCALCLRLQLEHPDPARLVLAIGMVVDDAIVVLENVHRRIKEGESPMVAAARGSSQVMLAVLPRPLSCWPSSLPILLWEGKAGKMFTEFAVAMSAAVCFSSLVALTLTPLLCARLLKSHEEVSLVGMVRGLGA
jgi:multidrug efflux pump